MSELCKDVYLTQDGYDSGQRLECPVHHTSEPVMDREDPSRQTYTVSLDHMIELVTKHTEELSNTGKTT